jgi:hypothetical protein
MDRLCKVWEWIRGPLAVGASMATLLAWRHEAPAWALEGLACVAAALWIKSDE